MVRMEAFKLPTCELLSGARPEFWKVAESALEMNSRERHTTRASIQCQYGQTKGGLQWELSERKQDAALGARDLGGVVCNRASLLVTAKFDTCLMEILSFPPDSRSTHELWNSQCIFISRIDAQRGATAKNGQK